MAIIPDRASPEKKGQNIRPPRGSWFNGQAYWITLYPELGQPRAVIEVKMILQFQFVDGDGGSWTKGEKDTFAHTYVDSIHAAWAEKFRITTTSTVLVSKFRDVGVIFNFPYYIDGFHTDDDFEIEVKKIPSGGFNISTCAYSMGNTFLDSEDSVPVDKGATMKQRGTVHEFGHMLGLRDEYTGAKVDPNTNHLGDKDSIMNVGEAVRERHYAPFAAWLTAQYANTGKSIEFKVNGTTDMSNALL